MKDFYTTLRTEDIALFCQRFLVPVQFSEFISRLFSEEEVHACLENEQNRFAVPAYDADWLEKEYHRGFLNKTEEPGVYRLNDLYGMLDVFAVSRKEEYDRAFTMTEKHELDDWYFDTYYERLVPDENGRLTEDRVMTLEETLEMIRKDPRQIYLNYCDCRSLTGECGKPTRTCLTYKNGNNTFADRGLSEPLTKEQAMDVVRMADARGLMHTTMSGGICNCCSDCCYLFRSQRRAETYGVWPASSWMVAFEKEKCIGCGRCARRCWMQVFQFNRQDKTITFDNRHCAGCGLCVSTCPAGALQLKSRGQEE